MFKIYVCRCFNAPHAIMLFHQQDFTKDFCMKIGDSTQNAIYVSSFICFLGDNFLGLRTIP